LESAPAIPSYELADEVTAWAAKPPIAFAKIAAQLRARQLAEGGRPPNPALARMPNYGAQLRAALRAAQRFALDREFVDTVVRGSYPPTAAGIEAALALARAPFPVVWLE
jgi:hypothetical protein